jgi:predicted N-acetyltransferase YhbS
MTDLGVSLRCPRAERIDRAVTWVLTRFAPLFPGGEAQDAGPATWTVSEAPLLVANGVIRYDARGFQGPGSERELDACLAVLSTYEVPWRFSAWDHLGAEVLVPRLVARGMTGTGSATAMWRDLPSRVPPSQGPPTASNGIEIRSAQAAHEQRAWAEIFATVFGIPVEYTEVFEKMAAAPHSISIVARLNGRAVGCLSMAMEGGLAVIYNLGVLPSARRCGVAGRMLQAAHEAAAARGADASIVVATPAGSGICARLGYQAVTSVTYLMPASPPSRQAPPAG